MGARAVSDAGRPSLRVKASRTTGVAPPGFRFLCVSPPHRSDRVVCQFVGVSSVECPPPVDGTLAVALLSGLGVLVVVSFASNPSPVLITPPRLSQTPVACAAHVNEARRLHVHLRGEPAAAAVLYEDDSSDFRCLVLGCALGVPGR